MFLLLTASVIAAVSLRVGLLRNSEELEHDDGISLLAATGHQADFVRAVDAELKQRWVEVAEWKKLIRSEAGYAFRQIGHDLSRYDIHPPLYFWLLHIWMKWTGDELPGVFMLIAILAGMTVVALFFLATHILKNSIEASVVAALWAVSPGACLVSASLRHYELFGLVSLVVAWMFFRVTDEQSPGRVRDYLALSLAAALGALAICRLARKRFFRLAAVTVSTSLGLLIAYACHPNFRNSIALQSSKVEPFAWTGVPERMITSVSTRISHLEKSS